MNEIEEQLVDLQSRVAFQDDTIAALNDALADQQGQIERLERMLKILNEQLKQIAPGPAANPADEPPPPHY